MLTLCILQYDIYYFYLIIICLHTVIWFQVLLSNTKNLQTIIWFHLFESNANIIQTDSLDPYMEL